MNNTEALFIELLKHSVFGAESVIDIDISKCGIHMLEEISKQHLCQVIVFDELKKVCKNESIELSKEFANSALQIIHRNYANITIQSEILNRFKERGIKCAVLKGISVAKYYKNPFLRVFGDIDILVPEDKYNSAIDVLLNGEERNSTSEEHSFHYALNYKGFIVEIHKHITEYDNEKDCLSDILKPVFNNIKTGKADIYEFPMLNTRYQAIAVLLHLKRHMTENNVNMRMLLDWLVFSNHISAEEWNSDVYPILEKLEINLLSDALFVLSDKYFATNNKSKIHFEKREFIADLLLEDFMASGIKDTPSRLSGNIGALYIETKKKNSFMKLISVLNELSRRNYSFSKYKILLPVCWVLISARYAYRVITHKQSKISILKIKRSISNKDKLYESLKLKDIEGD